MIIYDNLSKKFSFDVERVLLKRRKDLIETLLYTVSSDVESESSKKVSLSIEIVESIWIFEVIER